MLENRRSAVSSEGLGNVVRVREVIVLEVHQLVVNTAICRQRLFLEEELVVIGQTRLLYTHVIGQSFSINS
jgi:hypothetical protein